MINNRKMLFGSYFSNEYSISAALFNPSIVAYLDQSRLGKELL